MVSAALLILVGCEQPTPVSPVVSGEKFTVRGSASGYVVGPDGLPLSGVRVAYSNGGRAVAETFTNSAGMYEISNLASGTYDILYGGNGFSFSADNSAVTIDSLADIRDAAELAANPPVANTEGQIKQYIIDNFGNYNVNVSLGEMMLYPLTASIKGVAHLTIVDQDENLTTTVVPEGYLVGVLAGGVEGMFTARVGAAGAFTLNGLPASAPNTLIYNFFLVSSDTNTSTAVAFKIDDGGWHVVKEVSNNSETFEGFTAQLFPSSVDSRPVNVGNVTFKAAIAPTITDYTPISSSPAGYRFNPGTNAAPTPLTFTFSKAMNPTKGTLTVKDSGNADYRFTASWNTAGTVLTVTPSIAFELGETITASFTDYQSTDFVSLGNKTIQFYVAEALEVVSNSWESPLTDPDAEKVALNASPTITFNKALTGFTASKMFLKEDTSNKIVDATFTISGAVLTVDPTVDLKYGTAYEIGFEVTDGITKLASAADDFVFTTVSASRLAAPTINPDVMRKKLADSGESRYAGGAGTVYVGVSKAVADTAVTGFTFQSKKSTDIAWTDVGTATVTDVTSDTWYYTLTGLATWASGDILEVRAIATGVGDDSAPSSTITFTDEIAPVVGSVVFSGPAIDGTGTSTLNLADNASTTVEAVYSYTLTLGGEKMSYPVLSVGTTPISGVTYQAVLNSAGTQITIYIAVAKAVNATTPTNPAGQLKLTVQDAAGQSVDFDTATAGTQQLTINL